MDDDNGAGDHAHTRCNNRLCEAIRNNNLEEVRACISEGVDLKLDNICQSSKDHDCPLVLACLLAYEEIIEELLKADADPNHVSGRRRQSVMHKTAAGRVLTLSIMRCLISYGADVILKDGDGKTMLHYLAMGQFNDTDESLFSAVRLLLDNGAFCDAFDRGGRTPLYDACNSGNVNLAKLFIAEGADVNISHDDMTILHYLALGRNKCTDDDLLCVVKLLLDNGAICDARDRSDYTPLMYACLWLKDVKVDLVKLFIAEGADIAIADSERSPLLAMACKSGNIDLFDVLLNAGACRTLSHDDLHLLLCTKNNHALIARILDTCDVDINMAYKCSSNMTILHCVCYDRYYSNGTVQLLIDRGADIRAVTADGDTVLHYAVMRCDCEKIRLLLLYNHPVNTKNSENQTPLITLLDSMYRKWHSARVYRISVLAFKMLVIAGAKGIAEVEHMFEQIRIKLPEIEISDFEISSMRSLKEMCRFVIRGMIPVPAHSNICKLPIPQLLQKYLNFSELDQLVDEYLEILDDEPSLERILSM